MGTGGAHLENFGSAMRRSWATRNLVGDKEDNWNFSVKTS
jgi:hypothetical protein